MNWLEEMRAQHQAELARIDEKYDRLERRFDGIDKRLEGIDKRLDGVDQRLTSVEVRIAETKADLMKWSFVFWCGAVAAIAALAGVLRS